MVGTMPIFGAWQFSDLIVSGPDPFGSNALANADAVGATSFTIDASAAVQMIDLTDDDANLEDADGSQELSLPTTFDGIAWGAGAAGDVEIEYSYVIRPAGSADPADNITIFVLEFEGDVHGIASSQRLFAGQTYDIVAIDSNDPIIPYTDLAVCFARGTRIATKQGPVAVEDLRPGIKVQTADNGYRELIWTGRWRMTERDENAPIRIAKGALGNDRAFEVSAQHRLLVRSRAGVLGGRELLIPAKGLLDLPGIARAPRPRIEWLHLLFEAHEIVFADGAAVESLLPGPMALRGVGPQEAARLRALMAENPLLTQPARPILPPGQARRHAKQAGGMRQFLLR
ncbi:hypothetical protein BMI85_02925 [Thioclava sp. DLFJ4-1]|nr:hypothetical protein BMI85_02925 [Thioclava sp. DLFJ4-1]